MKTETFIFRDAEGVQLFTYKWSPDEGVKAKAVVEIVHGMAEHAQRYSRLAKALTKEGYIVYAADLRGHGRTAGLLENVGYWGKNGFHKTVTDLRQLYLIITKENVGLPVFVFGHSMGSFLAEAYISHHGNNLRGAILSGVSGMQPMLIGGAIMAWIQKFIYGPKMRSKLLNHLSFGSYNNQFKPTRTAFDWLSRDEAEVDKYVEDPYCGGIFTTQFYYDLFRGLIFIHQLRTMKKIPKQLPLYLYCGSNDPVGRNSKGLLELVSMYKKLGISDVQHKIYPDARHETLNEINREEVTQDLINWLNAHL
jgi:alpha-beta hydrolase superfamily lysophospholipase